MVAQGSAVAALNQLMSGPAQQLPLAILPPGAPSLESFYGTAHAELLERLQQFAQGASGRLWISGAAGTGKSHLMLALQRAADAHGVACYSLSPTVSGLSLVIGGGARLLLLEAADALAGLPDTEALLMQLCNEHSGALVLTAALHPAAYAWALPDLRSRLLAAELFRLQALTDDDRRQLLLARARAVGLSLSEAVLSFMLAHLPRDTANLLATMDRLDLASWVTQRRITIPFLRRVLELDQ